MLRLDNRVNYLTVPAALRELEKIEMVRCNNGRYRLDHAVSKRQKTILSSFGMDDSSIRRLSSEISVLLSHNSSLLPDEGAIGQEVEDDGEDSFYEFN